MNQEIKTDERRGQTSASNAMADSLCQGRHRAQMGLPDTKSDDSTFGTEIHDALAKDDPSKLKSDQLSIYEGCVEIREKLIMERFGLDASKAERITETRFWWQSPDGEISHSGKLDLLVRLGSEALIVEYKTLPGEVEESSSNLQLRDQASLAAGKHGLTEVDVAVVQPLVTYSPVVTRYDADSIAKAQTEMVARVLASNVPNATRTAGIVQCKYCLARFTCPERSKFMALSVPPAMTELAIPVAEWTPDQRALFCERAPVATKWIEECKNQIKDMLKDDPNSVPGWKLGEGRVNRPVNDPNELHGRFLASGGTTEQFMAAVSIGKGDFETQVRAATQLKGKGLKAKVDELLAGITDEKKSEPSLERIK